MKALPLLRFSLSSLKNDKILTVLQSLTCYVKRLAAYPAIRHCFFRAEVGAFPDFHWLGKKKRAWLQVTCHKTVEINGMGVIQWQWLLCYPLGSHSYFFFVVLFSTVDRHNIDFRTLGSQAVANLLGEVTRLFYHAANATANVCRSRSLSSAGFILFIILSLKFIFFFWLL